MDNYNNIEIVVFVLPAVLLIILTIFLIIFLRRHIRISMFERAYEATLLYIWEYYRILSKKTNGKAKELVLYRDFPYISVMKYNYNSGEKMDKIFLKRVEKLLRAYQKLDEEARRFHSKEQRYLLLLKETIEK